MSQSNYPDIRNFFCDHCGGEIQIPYGLPPTTAPCPFCKADLTSPAPPLPERAADASAVLVANEAAAAEAVAGVPLGAEQSLESESDPVSVALAPEVELTPELDVTPELESTPEVEEAPEIEEVIEDFPPGVPEEAPIDKSVEERILEALMEEDDLDAAFPEEALAEEALPEEALAEPMRMVDKEVQEVMGGRPKVASSRSVNPAIVFLGAALLMVGLVVLGIFLLMPSRDDDEELEQTEAIDQRRFAQEGWKLVASNRLRGFLGAQSIEEKAKHVIGGAERVEDMRNFYAFKIPDEADMPVDAFSVDGSNIENRERGIFLMRYERPAQFDIRDFFRPVAPLEVQYKLEEPGLLLSGLARLENFAMEPARAMVFFRQVGADLRIDWDTYVQTKYRTLRQFSGLPLGGADERFRVKVAEDIPDISSAAVTGMRCYRLTDPGIDADYVKVYVSEDSEAGQQLAGLNWVGVEGAAIVSRTATVDLMWSSGDDPRLALKQIVCWEFLGLGGEEGSAELPVEDVESGAEGEGGAEEVAPSGADADVTS